MGDDAEYYMEQMEAEAMYAKYAQASVRTTYEFCYNDYEEEDLPIFSWAPKGKPGWLARLHEHGIGERVFYARLDDEYYESEVGVIDEDTYRVVSEAHEADIEVIVASRKNYEAMKEKMGNIGEEYLEKNVFSGLISAMLKTMDKKKETEEFTFLLWM